MAVDVHTETVIHRTVDVVSSYAADSANAPAWYANIASMRWLGDPELVVGAQVAFTARFLGRDLTYTYEIVEHNPGQRLVMRTLEGPFPMETTYSWTALEEGSTRMTLRNRGEPSGFSSVAAPMLAAAMRRANRKDLDQLRALLEEH